jgi:hypothetical protein
MTELKMLEEILAKKQAKLDKVNSKLEIIGMDTLEDQKLANKRNNLRREASDLFFNIRDLKEIIKKEKEMIGGK